MNFFDQKDLGNHLLKLCPKVVKHPVDKQLVDAFPIQNGLKQGNALLPLVLSFALECAIQRVQENQVERKLKGHISSWSKLMM
jgi:hypothetical protein